MSAVMGGVRVWLLPFELAGDEPLSLLGVRSRLEAKTSGDGLTGAPPPPAPPPAPPEVEAMTELSSESSGLMGLLLLTEADFSFNVVTTEESKDFTIFCKRF